MTGEPRIEDLLRRLAPQVLAALVRRHGHFDTCEDAVQEALVAAAVQWPAEGLPENPKLPQKNILVDSLLSIGSAVLVGLGALVAFRQRGPGGEG